ncbi:MULTISPECIES: glycerol-3-phosphate dehydrogenase/oxidase [unclassified Leptospira]|uniref:glycerol-3-phosphate dehydrogenase/oxidase n=1 Tax=unclassified Leptospira TaxID=2633828 RepID=UPI0002BD365E|nr:MULTISPECIES: glycerol-3-phosphate dehydrogenase/oxidase [unclassified Leptospira]EMK01736.1 FAD dependent oxidoreductase [Leptospira sp. B5-022]MCR1793891.1 glycerol-3-phosphate dehydrogenase/oxidase [Leptospira sp. id769339]
MQKHDRKSRFEKLKEEQFDLLILGGGATGAGAALDASLRGLKVALLEKSDFSAGTSSRSTKLIHGGVRYLAQFHFKLIHEALTERQRLLENAPHLVKPLPFILPTYKLYEKPYYSIGMTMYDILAWKGNLPSHKRVSKEEVEKDFPALQTKGLTGGILYYDSQFNDARLNVNLARAASKEGALVLNQTELLSFQKKDGKIVGGKVKDLISGETYNVKAKVVVNATGPWVDDVRLKDDPRTYRVLSPSQGIHLVFKKEIIPCNTALIIPKTKDGRVVFIIPWEDHVILGTTDTPIHEVSQDPLPLESEVEFLLQTGSEYLASPLQRKDIISAFSGIRPLISPEGNQDTKSISREEVILVSPSGLITMGGGKWSTYRKMAEDLIDRVLKEASLEEFGSSRTAKYAFPGKVGYSEDLYKEIQKMYKVSEVSAKRLQNFYGGEVFIILGKKPTPLLKGAEYFQEEVEWFVKEEFALTVTDVLARRFRVQFLDLKFAAKLATPVSQILAKQLGWKDAQRKEKESEAIALIESLRSTYEGKGK